MQSQLIVIVRNLRLESTLQSEIARNGGLQRTKTFQPKIEIVLDQKISQSLQFETNDFNELIFLSEQLEIGKIFLTHPSYLVLVSSSLQVCTSMETQRSRNSLDTTSSIRSRYPDEPQVKKKKRPTQKEIESALAPFVCIEIRENEKGKKIEYMVHKCPNKMQASRRAHQIPKQVWV